MRKLAVYIHIPFCIKKCAYCDFLSCALQNERELMHYSRLIEKEIELMPRKQSDISSIFIGGGTPSLLGAKESEIIFKALNENYNILCGCEITIEANPETIDEEKLAMFKNNGVNRISLGVQSFDDVVLKNIARVHSASKAIEAAKLISKAGFESFNVDLMYGLPGQDAASVLRSVQKAVSLGATHISAYELILEQGTAMFEQVNSGEVILPSDDEVECMYKAIDQTLSTSGFEQYEISNYALPGNMCRHNLSVWKGQEYISAGYGASSMLYDEERSTIRYKNASFEDYEKAIRRGEWSGVEYDVVSGKDQMFEAIMLELRLVEGVDVNRFAERFETSIIDVYSDAIDKNIEKGLILADQNNIKLSEKGFRFQNQVLLDFMD